MSTNPQTQHDTSHAPSEFEIQRAALVGQIGDALEQVLTQINALNRSLEGIIEIGNDFASVEALWSQFETVMGTNEETENLDQNHEGAGTGAGVNGESADSGRRR